MTNPAATTRSEAWPRPGPRQPHDLDRRIGGRIRRRRTALGLSQRRLAERVGIAVGHLFADGGDGPAAARRAPRPRKLRELERSFARLPSRRHQQLIRDLARALARL
jgi:transcriptional regulator with XRE-family HTH domain